MLVQDIMHQPVTTVEAEASLSAAYQTMRDGHFRHLPVVQRGTLVGVVTDRDLRHATSQLNPTPFSPDEQVAQVMSRDLITTSPLDPVEEAARLMREYKIGCLPVLDAGGLVGLVTVTDLLDAMLHLTGLEKPSSRLALRLPDRPGEIARVMAAIAEQDLNVRSVLSYPEGETHHVILRVDTIYPRPLADHLRERGYNVLWPPEKPWSL